jgi:hypothetical protein
MSKINLKNYQEKLKGFTYTQLCDELGIQTRAQNNAKIRIIQKLMLKLK